MVLRRLRLTAVLVGKASPQMRERLKSADLETLVRIATDAHPEVPLLMIGHSMEDPPTQPHPYRRPLHKVGWFGVDFSQNGSRIGQIDF